MLEALSSLHLTVVIGRHAQAWHLPDTMNLSLGEAMRDWRLRWPEVMLLPHPSPRNINWFRRNAWFGDDLLPMLRARVVEILGEPPP